MSTYQTLSIIVYRASPVDSYLLRHVALYLEYSSGKKVYQNVTGAHGFFAYDEDWNMSPRDSANYERAIQVMRIQTATEDDLTIRNRIRSIAINNRDRSWNCQSWVGDCLAGLEQDGILLPGSAKAAIDKMVDVLLEARDVDE
ncbi:hypothetical protein PVAG01_02102 [Phlyctema vagabunda]|uniref:Uncharacterized protein n=1 Tax=Phlyctema vagabunda TaxID=108571 RepID=A0ABR4PPN5_9HELO